MSVMKGREKKQHLNRPHVRTRRADLLQCGPSQLAPRSMHILYLMQRNNQKMGGGGEKNQLPPTTTTGNPLATAESQSLHHNVQPASKKRITCFYLQPPLPSPPPEHIVCLCTQQRKCSKKILVGFRNAVKSESFGCRSLTRCTGC